MIAWLAALRTYWKPIAAAALLCALVGYIGLLRIQLSDAQAQLADARATYAERLATAERARSAALIEQEQLKDQINEANRAISDAYDAGTKRLDAERKARAADVRTAGRLRDTIAAFSSRRDSDAPSACAAESVDDRPAILGDLLGQSVELSGRGAGLAVEGRSAVEDAQLQLGALRDWVREVCLPSAPKLGVN